MARVQVLCWMEIPSVVEARAEGKVHKEQLSQRFQELIDLAAMRRKLAGTDAYLEEWNRLAPEERPGTAAEAAKAAAAEIEQRYETLRAAVLARSA